jgi:hypothetical protein
MQNPRSYRAQTRFKAPLKQNIFKEDGMNTIAKKPGAASERGKGFFKSPVSRANPKITMLLIFGLLLLPCVSPLFAEQETAFFAGLGPEVNMNTREGSAMGGSLVAGYQFNRSMAAGVKTTFSSNMNALSTMEGAGFFRMYMPLGWSAPFVQGEIGASVFVENSESFPAFSGGFAAGWRFNLGKNWYIEPTIRGGYPYIWGGGILAGLRFAVPGGNSAMGGM